ncbi:homocysteine S-methyltransferase family protein [Zavarzinia sp. CC-PAN008]|uniref:homocysteine S-methyltransferase family protein n=1 Tax=Zavarzinia sp. CC-PAN008 TaxID=3243332 RepID=UPI003F748D3C
MDTRFLVLDGGMGRELERRGAPFRQPEWSALALIEGPEHVTAVHEDFIRAGAGLITTNSYALVPFHLGAEVFDRDGSALAALSGRLAREAADRAGAPVLVAGSLPPVMGSYRPDLFDATEARRVLDVLVAALSPHVDLWLAETQSSIAEAAVSRAAVGSEERPFWVSFTLEDRGGVRAALAGGEPHLRSGESVAEAARAARDMGAQGLLFNCSLAEVMEPAIRIARATLGDHPLASGIGVYANAFEPKPAPDVELRANASLNSMRADLDAGDYAALVQRWLEAGATRLGGCCGIGPAHIAAVHDTVGRFHCD